ncbi:thiosulfate sulfurtransferase 18 isoform X1 [Ziziphus jujuba]|uniref:Thiosulfate sulfurtransferase 18 isoform X1 n=2 Tax=Ziziphus jujuba TaxID=326968 RepID=A0A6P4ALR7_ZIZJJ|nr:thiosulfate sulfurtransferase 18 isoform X1 [Ziziphus jujuba]
MGVAWVGLSFGFVLLVLLLFSPRPEVVTVDIHEAKELIKSGYGYLDVRTVEEFKEGHVDAPKIFNIPYLFNTPGGMVKNPEFLEKVSSTCKKEERLIVGCRSGVRSLSAAADMLKDGFKDVRNMGGGYLAWLENRFSIKKPEDELQQVIKLKEVIDKP